VNRTQIEPKSMLNSCRLLRLKTEAAASIYITAVDANTVGLQATEYRLRYGLCTHDCRHTATTVFNHIHNEKIWAR